jgi:hypothetical protein
MQAIADAFKGCAIAAKRFRDVLVLLASFSRSNAFKTDVPGGKHPSAFI